MPSDKKKALAAEVIQRLRRLYPEAHCSLDSKNSFELVVATILSAQCTDARVNIVTPALFAKFGDAPSMAKASQEEVEDLIRSAGFFRAKAKSLREMAQSVVTQFKGELPQTVEELTTLRGVGRKTANVVLGNAFGKPAGVVVDTHVTRLSYRLGLTKNSDAVKIERELNELVPQKDWTDFPHWLISHGRAVCIAQRPQCQICILTDICPKKGVAAAYLKKLPARIEATDTVSFEDLQ